MWNWYSESRTRDLEEKKYGLAAKEFLGVCYNDDAGILLKTYKDEKGKFGRILGELWRTTNYADKSVNDYMVEKYHAVAYYGQSKEDVAQQHFDNESVLT